MNRWIAVLSIVALTGTALAVGAHVARSRPPGAVPTAAPEVAPTDRQLGFLIDRSDSIEDGNGSSCALLVSLYRRAVAVGGVTERSRLQAFLTGDGVGRRMPKLGDTLPAPRIELGPDYERRNQMAIDNAVEDVDAICRAGMSQLSVSPVYDSLKAMIAQMHEAWGCSAAHPCSLLVASDLQETQHKGLREVLRGKKGSLPAALDTTGIEVYACGYGDTTERMSDAAVDATRAVWSQLVPGIVLAPSCA